MVEQEFVRPVVLKMWSQTSSISTWKVVRNVQNLGPQTRTTESESLMVGF